MMNKFALNNREVFNSLTVEENKALLDLLVFSVLADEHITNIELEQFDREIASLPFVDDLEHRDEIVQHSATTREELENNLGDEDYIQNFLKSVAEKLQGKEQRLGAIGLFCQIVLADGLEESEKARCYQVGEVLDIEKEAIDEIIDALIAERDNQRLKRSEHSEE